MSPPVTRAENDNLFQDILQRILIRNKLRCISFSLSIQSKIEVFNILIPSPFWAFFVV